MPSPVISLDQRCDGYEEKFLALVAEAGWRLAGRGTINAQQAAAWIVLDGTAILWRGQDPMDADTVVTIAGALAAIILGTYPQARPATGGTSATPAG
jgi:hypothetical protein